MSMEKKEEKSYSWQYNQQSDEKTLMANPI
jgi:hypothetical protein